MKFRRYTLVLLSLLVIVVLLLLFLDPRGSIRRESKQILIDDFSRIDQILIAGAADTVRLSRTGDIWQLPGGEDVNPVVVENLLFAAERLQVDAVHNDQGEWKGSLARKVSFMNGEKPVLQYEMQSQNGRFLLRPLGSEKAYTVSLPGYQELDLNRVFSFSENHFREHILIDLLPSEIRYIEVEKKGQPAFRFTMDEAGEISCELPRADSLIPMELLDQEAVHLLFTYFTSIRYEEKAGDRQPVSDIASLYVESNEGEKHSLQVYSLPGDHGEKEHLFKALVIYNNSPEPLVINYIYLDVLMRGLSSYIGDNL